MYNFTGVTNLGTLGTFGNNAVRTWSGKSAVGVPLL
jgi:hypothetical protein